jgi:AraC family transcriptional regulator, transcriptional activator of pobA
LKNLFIKNIDIKDCCGNPADPLIINLRNLLKNGDGLYTKPHRINYYQVILVSEGSATYCIDGREFSLMPKSFIASSKGQIEEFRKLESIDGNALLFSEEYIYKYPGDINLINNLKLFDQALDSSPIQLADELFKELSLLFFKIENEIKVEVSFSDNEILNYLIKIFLLECERIKKSKSDGIQSCFGDINYLSLFKQKLEENYEKKRAVNYYAELLCITVKKLNQITYKYAGKSAKQLIEERVLLEIKRQLIYTDHSAKEIGLLMGFNDPTNFCKYFKRYLNITPSDFRDAYKNTHLNYT